MSTTRDVWMDPELRDLIRTHPELVAVADALSNASGVDERAWRSRRLRGRRVAAAAAALAAAILLALAAPWGRSGDDSLSSLALAAMGSQPVLHVVADVTSPPTAELIDIETGKTRPVADHRELEIWYDRDQGLKHTMTRSGGSLIDEVLETPAGGFSPGGIVYDCAWIAAHPVEATKARVSCNPSMENGTTPRVVPRPKPTLNEALAGFLDGYRKALAEGTARETSTGSLDGRPVVWLEFPLEEGASQRVALDNATHKPLLVENSSGQRLQITSIGTVAREDANFRRPSKDALGEQPSYGGPVARLTKELELDPAALAKALPQAVWAGLTPPGLYLTSAEGQTIRTTFVNDARPPRQAAGLVLRYRSTTPDDKPQQFVELSESRTPQFGYGWRLVDCGAPTEGTICAPIFASGPGYGMGFTVVDGTYITIRASSADLLLATARALRPAA